MLVIVAAESLLSVIFNASTQSTSYTNGIGNLGSLAFLLIIVAWVAARRIMFAVRGRRFSKRRVLSLPVLYIFLTFLLIVPLEYNYPMALTSLLAIPAGFVVGYMFGKQVKFFNKNGALFFKRSPVVMVIWLVSYAARVILFYEFSSNLQVSFIFDAVLALTAGMLIGESIRILRSHSEYRQGSTGSTEGFEMMREL